MRTKNKDKELNHRHFVAVRLTDVELNLLDQGATCFSISRSEYLRKLLLEKQINHQIKVVADMNDLRKLVSEYGKIGSNLNQIAKHFNSGGSQSRAIENEIHQCITGVASRFSPKPSFSGQLSNHLIPKDFPGQLFYEAGRTHKKVWGVPLLAVMGSFSK